MLRAVLMAAVVMLPGAACAADRDIFAAMIDGFIRPGYADLAARASAMRASADTLCAAPGEGALESSRSDFAALVAAWSRIEIVRFGPIVADNRLERIFFWPDRRGIGLRQVQAVLAEEDATALDPDSLRAKSVAVQGLGALEFVLFGTGSEALLSTEGDFRCRYAVAIAGAIESVAEAVSAEWASPDGIAERLLQPMENYPDYRTNLEVMSELIGVFVRGTELLRDTRLKPFLGVDGAAPTPRSAPFWRSRQTLVSIGAAVNGMCDLLDASGIVDTLTGADAFTAGAFDFECANFAAAATGINPDFEIALADPAMRAKLDYLLILIGSLQDIVVVQLAPALGVSAGFSALDGD
jgi:predicted lipoprotein